MSRITDERARFSGQEHRIVVRQDGRRFWLDPAFLFALQNREAPDLASRLVREFGATPEEAAEIPELLRQAGLTGEEPK